jgi:hypothetical protein
MSAQSSAAGDRAAPERKISRRGDEEVMLCPTQPAGPKLDGKGGGFPLAFAALITIIK